MRPQREQGRHVERKASVNEDEGAHESREGTEQSREGTEQRGHGERCCEGKGSVGTRTKKCMGAEREQSRRVKTTFQLAQLEALAAVSRQGPKLCSLVMKELKSRADVSWTEDLWCPPQMGMQYYQSSTG